MYICIIALLGTIFESILLGNTLAIRAEWAIIWLNHSATCGADVCRSLLDLRLCNNEDILQNKERGKDIHRKRYLLELAAAHVEQDVAYHADKDTIRDRV